MNKSGLGAVAIVATLLTGPAASAEMAKRELTACTSEALLSQMMRYVQNKDNAGAGKLLESRQCVMISPGSTITILRPGVLVGTIQYNGTKLFTMADTLR